MEKFVQERVASGRYQDVSEVVGEGLRLLELQEREGAAAFQELKEKLKRGAAEAEAGELVDGDAYFEQLLSRLRSDSTESSAA